MTIDTTQWPQQIVLVVVWIVIGNGLLQTGIYILQLLLAAVALRSRPPVARTALLWSRYSDLAPPISLLAPAFNEERNIVESLRSLLALQYPNMEIVAINDGSRDATLERIVEAFDLVPVERLFDDATPHRPIRAIYQSRSHPNLIVVDKENGGKADALNAGINVSRAPLICCIDADSVLEADALLRAVRPFIEDPARMVAVGGTIRIANGSTIAEGQVRSVRLPRNLAALIQVMEYLRAFLMARLAWSEVQSLTIISGAFGVFRRNAVVAVGGYSLGTVGEDMELVIKLHRHFRDLKQPYRISFIPEPVCWTEAPESLRVLARQRARWHRGSLETFFKHGGMMFRPRYGRLGTIGFGNILIVDVVGPVVEVLGYVLIPVLYLLGVLNTEYFLAFLALTFAYGIFISIATLILEELELRRFERARDLVILGLVAVIENVGYRQLSNFWRLRGLWQFLRKEKAWGAMTRKGIGAPR